MELPDVAAEAGYTRAYYELGYLGERGLGRSQDLVEANRLSEMCSDRGDLYAVLAYGCDLNREEQK